MNYSRDDSMIISNKSNKKNKNEFQGDFTKDSSVMIKFIDWNERRHRVDAQANLKQ
jgi:hypothetical protein